MNNFVRTGLSFFVLALVTALFCVIWIFVPEILDITIELILGIVAVMVSVGFIVVLYGMHIELKKRRKK